MSDYDMRIHSSTDAREWTDFFFKTYPNCNVDREAMFGWFANAMIAMYDNKQIEQKPVNKEQALRILKSLSGLEKYEEKKSAND